MITKRLSIFNFNTMEKAQKLFIKQAIISLIVLFSISIIAHSFFIKDESSLEYVAEANKLSNLRVSSGSILDKMILKNNVTYDPTNGVEIKKVLENLEKTNKKKILILGSSQYITLNDDWSEDKYLRRVDKLLQDKFNGNVVVHNLSLGGMTIPEKKIILEKVLGLYSYDIIITSIGPYDSFKEDVRSTISQLENIEINPVEPILSDNKLNQNNFNLSIPQLNEKIETDLVNKLNDNVAFMRNKSAIKLWIDDLLKNTNVKNKSKEPMAWETFDQDLNNQTGWVSDFYKSSKRSLKIEKSNTKANSKWKGYKVLLEKPSQSIKFSSWYKTENVESAKLLCMDFKIDFADGTYKWYYKNLSFKNGTNDWTYKENIFKSNKTITAVTPHILFYEGTGRIWVDNVEARAIYSNGNQSDNLIVNPNMEKFKSIREVYSIEFNNEQWETIYKNSKGLLSYINKIVPKNTKNYLLIPPAYHSKYKSTYSQVYKLNTFYSSLKSRSENSGIKYLDASKILNESHFVEYKTGKKKGFIEPLHFDSKGHKILADFLYKNISF